MMGELHLPELWYAKAHMSTQQIFKDYFCDKICPGWSATPLAGLHTLAIKRIAELNTKMPDQWQYCIIGWELNSEKTDEVHVTTKDSERRALYTSPPAQQELLGPEYIGIPVAYQYCYPDGTWRCSFGDQINGSKPIASRALYARKDGK